MIAGVESTIVPSKSDRIAENSWVSVDVEVLCSDDNVSDGMVSFETAVGFLNRQFTPVEFGYGWKASDVFEHHGQQID